MATENHGRVILVTSLGGLLEAYDFTIYAHMAGYLSLAFFPGEDASAALLSTFVTFSVGYLARPLGALLFSHMGDRKGRKASFTLTIVMMAISTFLIGVLPVYAQVGILAPVLLGFMRLLQGFSFAGELPGGFTYLYETVPEHRQGRALSLLGAGTLAGMLLGVVMHAMLLQLLTPEEVVNWGWRIPFILGGSLGIVSYLVRRNFAESEAFKDIIARGRQEKVPFLTLVRGYKKELLTGLLVVMPVLVSVCLLILFIPGYLTRLLGYPAAAVSLTNALCMFAGIPLCLLMGWLADHFDRRLLLGGASAIIAAGAWPLFQVYASGSANLMVLAIAGAVMWGLAEGITLLLVTSLFPTHLRYTGMACTYNLGATVFAGFGPVIAMWLIQVTGLQAAPAFYLMISGFAGMLAACLLSPGQAHGCHPLQIID
ncbi:MAG: MFS transporter [Endozoicomonas sp.]